MVKGFETMNLSLTRRKFLSIMKKEKERKSKFFWRNCYCWSKVQGFCAAVRKWRICDVIAFFRCSFFGHFSVPCPGFCLPWWLIKCMYTTSYISAKIDEIWWDLKGCPIQARYPFRVSNLNLALVRGPLHFATTGTHPFVRFFGVFYGKIWLYSMH